MTTNKFSIGYIRAEDDYEISERSELEEEAENRFLAELEASDIKISFDNQAKENKFVLYENNDKEQNIIAESKQRLSINDKFSTEDFIVLDTMEPNMSSGNAYSDNETKIMVFKDKDNRYVQKNIEIAYDDYGNSDIIPGRILDGETLGKLNIPENMSPKALHGYKKFAEEIENTTTDTENKNLSKLQEVRLKLQKQTHKFKSAERTKDVSANETAPAPKKQPQDSQKIVQEILQRKLDDWHNGKQD
ncbi:MAG: hypothetical protein Q4F75_05280 [Pseudomonadota bacterium]|nr:hypothetical protein [Pseudomonadota bacterium]